MVLDAKLLSQGQSLDYSQLIWVITVQTRYVEGWWHQNWAYASPSIFFAEKMPRKWFFHKMPRTQNFLLGKFLADSSHGILTQSWFRICMRKGSHGLFCPRHSHHGRTLMIPAKCVLLPKIWRCYEECFGRNFNVIAEILLGELFNKHFKISLRRILLLH